MVLQPRRQPSSMNKCFDMSHYWKCMHILSFQCLLC
jgi:hypothetical protein